MPAGLLLTLDTTGRSFSLFRNVKAATAGLAERESESSTLWSHQIHLQTKSSVYSAFQQHLSVSRLGLLT